MEQVLSNTPKVTDLSKDKTAKALLDVFCKAEKLRRFVVVIAPEQGIYRIHAYPERSGEDV
jgi:hypothetical protein